MKKKGEWLTIPEAIHKYGLKKTFQNKEVAIFTLFVEIFLIFIFLGIEYLWFFVPIQ